MSKATFLAPRSEVPLDAPPGARESRVFDLKAP
jgi:hypothetical protein